MFFHLFTEEDGTEVIELDDAAIDYLEKGLAQLREHEVGAKLHTRLLNKDGVTELELRRA